MANKEINIFSVSFLDLLSGALAAVLILFVIVPKMSQSQVEALAELEQLQTDQARLEELVEEARNSVPAELYEQIQQQIEQMQQTIENLNNQVAQIQQRNEALEDSNEELREQIEQLQRQLEEARENQRPSNAVTGDGSVLGVNAQLAIACSWEENSDVDIYITDLRSDVTCYHGKKITSFGRLQDDITSREEGDTAYEMFYQSKIRPGRYKVTIKLYKDNQRAVVNTFAILNPGKSNEIRLDFNEERLSPSHRGAVLGILVVTQNSITIE